MACAVAVAQDSVDVVFRYQIAGRNNVALPGEFNNWTPAAAPMQYQGGDLWTRSERLRIGGNPNPLAPPIGRPGAWQYKFFTGDDPWPNDPLNHHVNANDNSNSFVYLRDPVIYHFLPNQRTAIADTKRPTISAYLYPKVGTVVDTTTIMLTIDDTTLTHLGDHYNFMTQQFVFELTFDLEDGGHTAILNAGANADTVSFVVQSQQAQLRQLPEYAHHGVTLPSVASNDSTTFRLLLPQSSFVVLRIAPAGENPAAGEALLMYKHFSSNDWWINLHLEPGTYEYLYQTDHALIYDPWGRWNGEHGSRFTIGTAGLTADDYEWQSNDYVRPPLNQLIMYEMNVGEFGGGFYGLPGGQSGFAELTTLLPYLDSLGVNAIELMPINDYGNVGRSGHSWGYDLNTYFALEPAYGTPRDFKVLVDSAHARGIAVIVDVVFNHLNDTAPLWQMLPDEGPNPYFKPTSQLRPNEDALFFFRDMDHWAVETQEIVYQSLKMWIDEYRVDGFRYDFTQGIGWSISEPTRGILGWSNRITQEYNNSIYQIIEHLPESPALVFHSGITGGWHDSFRDEVFDEARFRNTSLLDFENLVLDLGAYQSNDTPATPNRYANRTEPVNMNVNHDEQSLIYEMTTFQGVSVADAVQRDKLYATLIFTSLGIPLLWQGMEFSEPRGWPSDNQKLVYRPVTWSWLQTERGQDHFDYYQALILHRKKNPALYQGTLRKLQRFNTQKILVWGFDDATSLERVVVAANFQNSEQTVTDVQWLGAGDWFNIFDQSVLSVTQVPLPSLTIPAYSALVYASSPDSIVLSVPNDEPAQPATFRLYQNFPNPFNPTTTIRFDVPAAGNVTLKIYNVLGQEIRTLVDEFRAAGQHTVQWDGKNVRGGETASGIYILRFSARENEFVKSMKLLKLK
jgi:1,4-alpha-glucan branching enzyme